MKILVCISHVPDTTSKIQFTADGAALDAQGIQFVINPHDEEALKRIINFPARGIGQTTIDKLIVAANNYNKSIFEIISNLDKVDIKLNSGTRTKLDNFATMIASFQVMNQTINAFELAEHVTKVSGIIREFNNDGTPEGIARGLLYTSSK